MPFDFPAQTATAAYLAAGPDADWRAIADALYAHIVAPKVRAPKKAAPVSDGEWCEYTDAQSKGRGVMFHAGRVAEVMFADATVIRVGLSHKVSLDCPDWARAARVAVSYYRAKLARRMMIEADQMRTPSWEYVKPRDERAERVPAYGHTQISGAELAAQQCAIPEIVAMCDTHRGVDASVTMANASTAARRAAQTERM